MNFEVEKSSSKSFSVQLTELKQDKNYQKKVLKSLLTEKSSLTAQLQSKDYQCIEIQNKLNIHLENIKLYQKEADDKVFFDSQTYEKLLAEVENNDKKIEELESSVNFYCNSINANENEGRASAVKFAQLQSSYKKAQELYSQAISEKNRLTSLETENKKQKIFFSGKIDKLAEEKEILLNKTLQIDEEISSIAEEISKNQNLESLKTVLINSKNKEKSLREKIQSLSESLEEENDLKNSLLFHKQNEVYKLKENLNSNKAQIESLIKEFHQRVKKEEKDKKEKVSNEFFVLKAKIEEMDKELKNENNKVFTFQSQISQLLLEKQKFENEFKKHSETLGFLEDEHKKLVFELENKEKEKNSAKSPENLEKLEEYSKNLESKIKEMTFSLSETNELKEHYQEKEALESKVKGLQSQLNECNEFALKSRNQVSEAISEIENYAKILSVMEEKMNETEETLEKAIYDKNQSIAELSTIRQQYYNLVSGSK